MFLFNRQVNEQTLIDQFDIPLQGDDFDDIREDAVKIGMVSDKQIIKKIAARLNFYKPPIIVVDPVMVSKSGYRLLAPDACETLIKELLPIATLVTPNLPEASVIVGYEVNNKEDMLRAAKDIIDLGAKSVLMKGGHLDDSADDLLYNGTEEKWFTGERINTKNTHGTGCTLSSALAANLALGLSLPEAVRVSKEYITAAIENSLDIYIQSFRTRPESTRFLT